MASAIRVDDIINALKLCARMTWRGFNGQTLLPCALSQLCPRAISDADQLKGKLHRQR
jgi:hypothetical protein